MSLAQKNRRVTRREDLAKGEEVIVLVRVDREGAIVKRKKALVKDVLRKAAVLDVEGEKECRTVRFNEIERLPPPAPLVPPVPSKKEKRLHAVPEMPAYREPEPEPEPEPAPAPILGASWSPAPAAPALDDWMSQGTQIQEQLIQQAHAIENRASEIEAEAYELQRQADLKLEQATAERSKLATLRKRITLLDALRAGLDE